MPRRKPRKNINKEMVMTAKRLIEQNKKTQEIQEILDLSRATTCRLIKEIVENENYIDSFDEKPSRESRNYDKDKRIKESIESILNKDNSLTQKGIQEKLREENFQISQPSISLKLKAMKYSRKRLKKIPSSRNTDRNLDERRSYSLNILTLEENS